MWWRRWAGCVFALHTGRLKADDPRALRRRDGALQTLELLDHHLESRDFFVGERYSIADIAIYGYAHVADEAGLDLDGRARRFERWLERGAPSPDTSTTWSRTRRTRIRGRGRSIYD